MKRLIILIATVLMMAGLSAQSIDLGKFPKGSWVDRNWNAVWEFGANSIKLYDTAGSLLFDFDGKIENFKVDVGVSNAKISFSCKETQRSYLFTKGLADLNLDMKIDPEWTTTDYSVTLEFKK